MNNQENLLGCSSSHVLYTKLLDKSIFVFPEYGKRARQGISKHTTNLIVSGVYSSGDFVDFSYNKNYRLFYHLKKLAEKGFASYANGKRKGLFKLDLEKIKTGWLEIDHKKTEDEFKSEAIQRIERSVGEILHNSRILIDKQNVLPILSDVASNLEILVVNLENSVADENKNN